MKRFTEQLQNRAKTVKMTAAERAALRERLTVYMEYHPLSDRTTGSSNTQTASPNIKNVTSKWVSYWRPLVGSMTVIMLLLVPVLAERSVPGDILYGVKVKFNEEVRGSMSSTTYEEVEWATEQLNRRLVEAQLLAQEGRLTNEFETEVAAAIRQHSNAARDSIAAMREENPEEAAIAEITLTALLDVHASVLLAREQNQSTSPDSPVATTTITAAESVGGSAIAEALAASREDTGTTTVEVSRPSIDRLLSQIETESSKAYALLELIEPTKATTVLDSVPRRLEDIERKVQAAIVARDTGDVVEARVLLTEGLVRTRKVITYMENWQLGSDVNIDQIVPIEYTATELTEQLRFKEERLQVRYDYILSVVDSYATTTAVTEVASLLAPVPIQFSSSSIAIDVSDFATAGTLLDDIERALNTVVSTLQIPDRLTDPVVDTDLATTTSTTSPTDEVQSATTTFSNASSTPDEPAGE